MEDNKMAQKKIVTIKKAKGELFGELLKKVEEILNIKGENELARLPVPEKGKKPKSSKKSKKKSNPLQAKISMFNNWKNGSSVGGKAAKAFVENMARALILSSYKIVAELEPIRVSDESAGSNQKETDFFEAKDMKKILGAPEQKGIYIFYDSMGEAIYAGKTEKNTLWQEMKSAYNRKRSVQQKFKRTSGITIYKKPYYLYEVAAYASVYSVKSYAIGFIEALLIHSFPNDLTNVRVEKNGKLKFESESKKKAKKVK